MRFIRLELVCRHKAVRDVDIHGVRLKSSCHSHVNYRQKSTRCRHTCMTVLLFVRRHQVSGILIQQTVWTSYLVIGCHVGRIPCVCMNILFGYWLSCRPHTLRMYGQPIWLLVVMQAAYLAYVWTSYLVIGCHVDRIPCEVELQCASQRILMLCMDFLIHK